MVQSAVSFLRLALSACTVVLLLSAVKPAAAQDVASSSSKEKLGRAEEVVDRFLKRFNETLDVAVPYREMYRQESRMGSNTRGRSRVELELIRREDDLEIAMMNIEYLSAAYMFSHEGPDLPPEIKAAHGEELFPYLADINYTNKKPLKVQRQKWRNYFNNVRRLAALYRKYLPPSAFASPLYRARVEQVDRSIAGDKPRSRVERGYNNDKEFENPDVYRVIRAGFEYTLIEEDGAFKVIHINPIPGFRLFC